jgi:AraC family transcriptional regulator of adaptative response/methylated-DNA-[protein]-cysteine methyltransferase
MPAPRAASAPRTAPPDDAAWEAVLARDAHFDGRFVYAVRSTGVYCRPACASRRPRRDRVRFFPDPDAAEQAGFRACRRCRPREAGPSEAARRVAAARAFLETHAGERVTLPRLAAEVGLSPAHLQRVFTRAVGLSPKAYAETLRLERFQASLRGGADVATAGYGAGYGSASRVYEQAAARLGMTPGRYRQGGAGLRLRVATAPTSLGRVLVAASERGVCAVSFGASDAELLSALQREYPRAEVEPAQGALDAWLEAVRARLEGRAADAPPLDVPGTTFQWRVWRALQAIPPGETRTYGELAASLGRPGAARAVARACASNRVALLVPCHRVVAGDGVGGYRWGVERKQKLLRRERERFSRS